MAAVHARAASRRCRKTIEARLWKRGRRAAIVVAAVRDSERVRAHLNERMFPTKPDIPLIEPVRLTTRGGAVGD